MKRKSTSTQENSAKSSPQFLPNYPFNEDYVFKVEPFGNASSHKKRYYPNKWNPNIILDITQ